MSDLVQRLANGTHPITAGGPNPSVEQLKQSIGRKYVHIKFTQTRGGTDLGVSLDTDASSWQNADFEKAKGSVHLEGTLTLDYVPVRCVADLDLATLNGTGQLVIVEASTSQQATSSNEPEPA